MGSSLSPALLNSANVAIKQGAPIHESLFVLTVLQALRRRLIGARDLIIDSAPILAWRRADPDAAYGHAPARTIRAFHW